MLMMNISWFKYEPSCEQS